MHVIVWVATPEARNSALKHQINAVCSTCWPGLLTCMRPQYDELEVAFYPITRLDHLSKASYTSSLSGLDEL